MMDDKLHAAEIALTDLTDECCGRCEYRFWGDDNGHVVCSCRAFWVAIEEIRTTRKMLSLDKPK